MEASYYIAQSQAPMPAATMMASGQTKGTKCHLRVRTNLSDVGSSFAPADGGIPRRHAATPRATATGRTNDFLTVKDKSAVHFHSIDVDTASYLRTCGVSSTMATVRRPISAVRIEELVNYFPYRYQAPTGNVPFAANLEVASAPWAPEHRLVRIGLKGRELSEAAARPAGESRLPARCVGLR